MIKLSYKDNQYIFTGDTFPYKDQIKSLYFQWNVLKKYWYKMSLTKNELEKIKLEFSDDIEINVSIKDDIDNYWMNERKKLEEKYQGLFSYQIDAILFGKDRNVIICDEMGLGKTVESIILANEYSSPILVVTPKSVLGQWKQEIKRWLEEYAHIVEGNRRISQYFSDKWTIVNYEKLVRDFKEIKIPKKFILICDEASKLKNYKTKNYKCVKTIVREADKVIFLTGTPIENKLSDFFNIGRLVNPGFMTVKGFKEHHCNFKKVWIGRFRTIEVVEGYKNLKEFVKKISMFCIRRKREDVMDQLLELQVQVREIEMSLMQKRIYNKIINAARLADKGKFEILQLLRILADDLRLFNDSNSDFVDELGVRNVGDRGEKIRDLKEIVGETDSKIIIFTQFAKMATLISKELDDSVLVIGGMNQKTREEKIEEFKNDKRILVSTDCLAYGVNLQSTGAIVINFDLPWNPAVYQQRISRVYGRIGGQSHTLVINMICKGIEDHVYKILKEKQKLFDDVVEGEVIEDVGIRQLLISKFLK